VIAYREVEVKIHKLFTAAMDGSMSSASGLVLRKDVLDKKLGPVDELDVVGKKIVLTSVSNRMMVVKSINSCLIIPLFRLMASNITDRGGLEYS
jgi:hypothetical protein